MPRRRPTPQLALETYDRREKWGAGSHRAIYPVGFFAPLLGIPDDVRELVYNVADLVNKVGLCLVVYVTAKRVGAEEAELQEQTPEEEPEAGLAAAA